MSDRYEVPLQAIRDMNSIWAYIAKDSEEAATRLVDKFLEEFENLAAMPGTGRRREELAPGLHSFPVGNYLIFYRIESEIIRIVRIVHGSRDLRRLFRQRRQD